MNDDYNGPERRTPPEPTHVSVDALSNGAKKLFESVLSEAREMRREAQHMRMETSTEIRDARRSVVRWLAGTVVTLGIVLGGSIWGAAAWSTRIERDVGEALTIREYVESRTAELADELAANGAADELTRSAQLQNAAEFKAQLEALRRDYEREHGRGGQ